MTRAARFSPLERALVALLVAGAGFLAWRRWGAGERTAAAPPATAGTVAAVDVPGFEYFAREGDGMPVGRVDADALARFLAAHGIPPFGLPPAPIEEAVARRFHAAMQQVQRTDSAEAYGRLGRFFDVLGMHDQALACFEAAVERAPDQHAWHHYLGRALATRGELERAEAALRRAMQLAPEYLSTQWRLARLCAEQGRDAEAEELLRATLERAVDPYALTELALLDVRSGEWDAARAQLERALAIDPGNGRAHAALSQVLAALGEHERAEEHARRGRYTIKGLDPIPDPIVQDGMRETDAVGYHRIAARAAAPGSPEQVALWERVCRADPGNADDKIALSNAYFDAGRTLEAVAALEEALAQEPLGARFHLARAQLAVRMDDAETALRHARRASELEETPVAALGILGMVLRASGRVEEAVEPAERALALAPDNPDVYAFLASVYAGVGRAEEALDTYRRGLAVAPDSTALKKGLAELERLLAPDK